jgi:DNA-binding response OmpR family regulator
MPETVIVVGQWSRKREVILALQHAKHEVLDVADSNDALELTRQNIPCAIIMDEGRRVEQGIELLRTLREATPAPIIVQGSGKQAAIVRTLITGADAYVPRADSPETLLGYLRALLRRNKIKGDELPGL